LSRNVEITFNLIIAASGRCSGCTAPEDWKDGGRGAARHGVVVGWVCDVEVEIMPPGGAPPSIVEAVFGGTMETSIAKPFGESRLKQACRLAENQAMCGPVGAPDRNSVTWLRLSGDSRIGDCGRSA
jgi:hypothetical protein